MHILGTCVVNHVVVIETTSPARCNVRPMGPHPWYDPQIVSPRRRGMNSGLSGPLGGTSPGVLAASRRVHMCRHGEAGPWPRPSPFAPSPPSSTSPPSMWWSAISRRRRACRLSASWLAPSSISATRCCGTARLDRRGHARSADAAQAPACGLMGHRGLWKTLKFVGWVEPQARSRPSST
jgi:hypothetical protein